MKNKILTLFVLLFAAMSLSAQSNIKEKVAYQLKELQTTLIKTDPKVAFSEAQMLKLERILMKRMQEKVQFQRTDISKSDFSAKAKEINEKYQPQLQSVMNKRQKEIIYTDTTTKKVD